MVKDKNTRSSVDCISYPTMHFVIFNAILTLTVTIPDIFLDSPSIVLISVDFPAPTAPTSATNCPCFIEKFMLQIV